MLALTPDGRLSSSVKKTILLNNIYGVDLDEQAVEVTKLSLLLKCLEGETLASIQHALGLERVLPTIDHNIRVGNSLVEADFYDGELDFAPGTEKTVKPFSWQDEFAAVFKQGGFDAVLGNPPWVDLKGHPVELIAYYFRHYKTASNRINLYALFIEKAIRLLKPGKAYLGVIIPNSLLYQSSYGELRALLLAVAPPSTLIRLPDNTFENVKAESLIVITTPQALETEVLIYDRGATISEIGESGLLERKTISPTSWATTPLPVFDIFSTAVAQEICAKMESVGIELVVQCEFCLGLTPYDKYRGHSPAQIKGRVFHSLRPTTASHKPLLAGGDVARYHVEWQSGEYINYGPWLGAPREARFFSSPRILVRQIISGRPPRIYAGYTEAELYNTQSLFAILLRKENTPERLQVLLGLLNSALFTFYHATKYLDQSKVTFQKILIQDCKKLPIIQLDKINQKMYAAIVTLVDQLTAGYRALPTLVLSSAQEQAQSRLRHLERRLDALVYVLYGLTEAEIAHVTNKVS